MSFRRRVILLSATAVAVAIAVASAIVYLAVRTQLRDQVDSELESDATRTFAEPIVRKERLVLPRSPLGGPTLSAQLVAADGEIVRPSRRTLQLPPSEVARAVAAGERDATFGDLEVEGTHLRVYTAQARRGEAIQVARSLEEVDDTLAELLLILAAVSIGGVGLGAGLGWLVSRTALAPVARLNSAAGQVAETLDLSRRIDPSGGGELSGLARSFNAMLDALSSALHSQRQLVADASHELRTPLASLRTNIEVLAHSGQIDDSQRAKLLADVVTQLDELTVLVGDLVDLARDVELEDERPEPLRLDRLVAEAVERVHMQAPSVKLRLEADPCTVHGVEGRLERAVSNLLDNAVKWSPPEGPIEVSVDAAGEIAVRDHGPGIDADDLRHVFDRFYRSTEARGLPGSGLGLAIVRQVVEAHGGEVEATTHPGGGALFRMRLPAEPALTELVGESRGALTTS